MISFDMSQLERMEETLYRAESKIRTNMLNVASQVSTDPKHGAEALIQGVIMSTPSDIVSGKKNRYDTGNMHDKADGFTVMNNEGLPTIYFGWPDAEIWGEDMRQGPIDDSQDDWYFFTQEFGGVLYGLMDTYNISPMGALDKVMRDYTAMTGVAHEKGKWKEGTVPRLMPKIMDAIYKGLRGERV